MPNYQPSSLGDCHGGPPYILELLQLAQLLPSFHLLAKVARFQWTYSLQRHLYYSSYFICWKGGSGLFVASLLPLFLLTCLTS